MSGIDGIEAWRWFAGIWMTAIVMGVIACGRPVTAPTAYSDRASMAPPAPSALPNTLPEIPFTIQVGAFTTSERAARYANSLLAAGLDAYYFIDDDNLYKVRLDRFETREAAMDRALEWHTQTLIDDFFIVHPQPPGHRMDPRIALQEGIVETARRFLGTDYRWGGSSQSEGFDCSGLTMTVYRLNGLHLPRNALSQFQAGIPVPRNAMQPGDLVFFDTSGTSRISHVGIYSGQGRFIHAPSSGNVIRSASLSNRYFADRFKGARRYF